MWWIVFDPLLLIDEHELHYTLVLPGKLNSQALFPMKINERHRSAS